MSSPRFSAAGAAYFKVRGIDPEMASRCGVREENGAIVWPTVDADGAPALRRRSLNGGPKVRGPAGATLGVWWPTGPPDPGRVVLVAEGESDALAALSALARDEQEAEARIARDAVTVASVPGTGFPADRLVRALCDAGAPEAILALDGDAAGRAATAKMTRALIAAGLRVRALQLADGEDLASTLAVQDQPAAWLGRAILDAEPATAIVAERADLNGSGPPAASLEQRLADTRVDLLALIDDGLPERAWLPESERMLACGARHHVAAPMKSGKSLCFLAHAVNMVIAGARVVILDRENGEGEYARRLHDILADRPASARDAVRDRLAYYAWTELKLTDSAELGNAFGGVDLVVLDSTRTLLSALALDENSSDDFAKFSIAIIEPLFRAGIASVQLDNTGHGDSSRARGSSTKGDLADVLYSLKPTQAFDANRRGRLRLARERSRYGDVAPAFSMDLGAGHFGTFTPDEASASESAGHTFRPTHLMEKVSRALEDAAEGLSVRSLTAAIGSGKNRNAEAARSLAIDTLVTEGYVTVEPGPRNAEIHQSLRPFRENTDDDRPRTVPAPSPGTVQPTVPLSPPSLRGTGDGGQLGRTAARRERPRGRCSVTEPTRAALALGVADLLESASRRKAAGS